MESAPPVERLLLEHAENSPTASTTLTMAATIAHPMFRPVLPATGRLLHRTRPKSCFCWEVDKEVLR